MRVEDDQLGTYVDTSCYVDRYLCKLSHSSAGGIIYPICVPISKTTINLLKLPDPCNHVYPCPSSKLHCSRLHFVAPLKKG